MAGRRILTEQPLCQLCSTIPCAVGRQTLSEELFASILSFFFFLENLKPMGFNGCGNLMWVGGDYILFIHLHMAPATLPFVTVNPMPLSQHLYPEIFRKPGAWKKTNSQYSETFAGACHCRLFFWNLHFPPQKCPQKCSKSYSHPHTPGKPWKTHYLSQAHWTNLLLSAGVYDCSQDLKTKWNKQKNSPAAPAALLWTWGMLPWMPAHFLEWNSDTPVQCCPEVCGGFFFLPLLFFSLLPCVDLWGQNDFDFSKFAVYSRHKFDSFTPNQIAGFQESSEASLGAPLD